MPATNTDEVLDVNLQPAGWVERHGLRRYLVHINSFDLIILMSSKEIENIFLLIFQLETDFHFLLKLDALLHNTNGICFDFHQFFYFI